MPCPPTRSGGWEQRRDQLAADDQVSVVIISSALDKAFCVGADLKERRGFDNDDLRRQRLVFQKAFGALLRVACPDDRRRGGICDGRWL